MESHRSHPVNLRKMVREHLELSNNRRNFVLTILAAIFLPLSFVTSLLGMNMDTATPERPMKFSKWTKTRLDGISPDLRNSTEALMSALGTTGPNLWSWKDFWIISGCLIVTLPLSLTLGAIFGLSIRYVTHYVAFWRALALIPSVMFIMLSIFGKEPMWLYILYSPKRSRRSSTTDILYNLGRASLVINGLLIFFEVVKVYLAWKNKRHRAFWSAILLLTSVCFTIDEMFSVRSNGWLLLNTITAAVPHKASIFLVMMPWMAFPWLWFALRWAREWSNTRKRGGGGPTPAHQVPPS